MEHIYNISIQELDNGQWRRNLLCPICKREIESDSGPDGKYEIKNPGDETAKHSGHTEIEMGISNVRIENPESLANEFLRHAKK